jgi:hypothetical protein
LPDNQAGHNARLSRLEEIVERLGQRQEKAQAQQEEMRADLCNGLREMREGLDLLTTIVERSSVNIQKVYELETHSRQRLNNHERRLAKLEDGQDSPA